MRFWGFFSALCLSLGLVSCAGPGPETAINRPNVDPQDFVLLPCGPADLERPCALAIAGGKRVLFGAPAGVAQTLSPDDLWQLDAVILFSLRAASIEGLDEVRNESWQAGRDTPLLVIGPREVDGVITGLNAAFEQADALRIVEEGIPPGGYDAAILTARGVTGPGVVFDTGDVVIRSVRSGFEMSYNQQGVASLSTCGAGGVDQNSSAQGTAQVRVGCDATGSEYVWPLSQPVFIVDN